MNKIVSKLITVMVVFIATIALVNYETSWAVDNVEDNQQAQQETEIIQDEMKFLYIESPLLESPGTQNIAVSWKEDITVISEMYLIYSDANKKEYELKERNRTENSILFTKEFSTDEVGEYTIKGVKYIVNEEELFFAFDDIEVEASFKVQNEVKDVMENNISEIQVASKSTISTEVEAQMVDALETANVPALTSSNSSGSKNVVVVLDPGHGGSDPGAVRNRLREADLTMKIAKYCKAELEEYQGVDVYLTHTGQGFSGSTANALQGRVNVGIDKKADVLVSLHINAGGGKGVEVWTPNSSYNWNVYEEGKQLSNDILNEIVALGLTNRGVKVRNSEDNTQYPNGSLADYYGIIRRSKLAGFPGIIVEHAFIDNANDANFLKSEQNVKNLGIANANGIAKYFGLAKEPAADISEGTYTINTSNDNKRLAVEGSSIANGSNINVVDNTSEVISSQRFEIIKTGNKEYRIALEHSGKVLDVKGGAANPGVKVQQYQWNENNAQRWYFIDTEEGNNSYYIKSKLGTYLTINGASNYVETTNKNNATKWVLNESETRPIADGIYGFSNMLDSSMMMDINGASLSDGANIQLYKANNTIAQKFEVKYVGNGYYKIQAVHSNKSLDVSNASTKDGANLWQYSPNGTNAQLWKFIDAGNGYFHIKSKLGTVISPVSNQIKSSTNIHMETLTGANRQKWMLEDISREVSDGAYLFLSEKDNMRNMTIKSGNAQINAYDNADNQKYNIKYVGNGYYKIENKATGKVLSVANSSKSVQANLIEENWRDSNNDNKLWEIISNGSGVYVIKSKVGTFIDVSSGSMKENNNVWMYSYNGTSAQKWKLDASRVNQSQQPIKDGTYTIKTALKNNAVMDISGGSLVDKSNVQIYTNNNTSAQRFEVTYVGNGYYKIINEKSGKTLDVAGGSTKAETNLWQYTLNGTEAQLWKFLDAGNGYYYIKSAKGTVVDVSGGNSTNGTNIWLYSLNGTNAQKWKMDKASYKPLAEGDYTFVSGLSNSRVMECNTGSSNSVKNIRLGEKQFSDNQKFSVASAGDEYGYYKISVAGTGEYLEVEKTSGVSGMNLQTNKISDSPGQLWKFIDAGNGYYFIKSKLGTTIDVEAANKSIGTNVQLYSMNATLAQKWKPTDNDLTPIMGKSNITANQLTNLYNSKGKIYPYKNNSEATNIESFAQIYIEECNIEGVRADIAFCQAMKETGWLQFGGDVKSNQYNFAGIGATGNGNSGNSFSNIRTGIRAHIQHLKAYASREPLNNACVDPRFNYVQRGVAPYVEWLGQKENPDGKGWATAIGYGDSIMKVINQLNNM